jgi:hypothetical protein
MGIACCNRIVAFACIVCTVRYNTPDLFVWWDLVEQIREHRRITSATAGCLDCTYFQFFSSIPIYILRQRQRFEPPCLRAFHSPSTFALMPVLSAAQQ